MRRILPALAFLALSGCPSDGQFGSLSPVLSARVVGEGGASDVLPGDAVELELLMSGGQSIDAAWVNCNSPVFGRCTRGGPGVSVPFCPDELPVVEGFGPPCVTGLGPAATAVIPPIPEEGFVPSSNQFEVWHRPGGGDVSRCVDGRVHGCSVFLFRAEFGPSYALAEAALAAQNEIQPPLEAYDEALQMAEPNRHPILSGVELDGELVGTGSVVDWDRPLTLRAAVDDPEDYVRIIGGPDGALVGEASTELQIVTWVVKEDGGRRIVEGPVLRLEAPDETPEPTVVDVLVEDGRGGVGAAWVELR